MKINDLKLKDVGEFGLIELVSKISSKRSVVKGIGDDTAVVRQSSKTLLLLTTDMLIEGIHFKSSEKPQLIGRKALGCSVSDIAAMGGRPKYAVVSIGVKSTKSLGFVKKLYQGMRKLADDFGVTVVGGDTVKSNKLIINIALIGQAKESQIVYRRGAKKGDKIFVTGRLGSSLNNKRHLKFTPKIDQSQYLVKNFKPSSMIDISDGLISDLGHILKESRVGAHLYQDEIPKRRNTTLKHALYDGEDYELIFTLNPKQTARILKKKKDFFLIGEIVDRKEKIQLVSASGQKKPVALKGFRHF